MYLFLTESCNYVASFLRTYHPEMQFSLSPNSHTVLRSVRRFDGFTFRVLFQPRKVVGRRTDSVGASPCAPAILVHVCEAAQHAKGLSEGERRSVIIGD